jgi:DNA-binding NarL/FixJ family response regulator
VVDAQQSRPALGYHARRQAADVNHVVLVAMSHPTMRARTCAVLACSCGCRVVGVTGDDASVADAIARYHPDLVVLDTGVFPGRYASALHRFPVGRAVVVGPEPDDSYREAALSGGAGGWIPRDGVGDDLGAEVCRVLACPCPRPGATGGGSCAPDGRSG